jgi:hypothetical protein
MDQALCCGHIFHYVMQNDHWQKVGTNIRLNMISLLQGNSSAGLFMEC